MKQHQYNMKLLWQSHFYIMKRVLWWEYLNNETNYIIHILKWEIQMKIFHFSRILWKTHTLRTFLNLKYWCFWQSWHNLNSDINHFILMFNQFYDVSMILFLSQNACDLLFNESVNLINYIEPWNFESNSFFLKLVKVCIQLNSDKQMIKSFWD